MGADVRQVEDEYFSETYLSKLLQQQSANSTIHQGAMLVEQEIKDRQARLTPEPLEELSDDDFRQ